LKNVDSTGELPPAAAKAIALPHLSQSHAGVSDSNRSSSRCGEGTPIYSTGDRAAVAASQVCIDRAIIRLNHPSTRFNDKSRLVRMLKKGWREFVREQLEEIGEVLSGRISRLNHEELHIVLYGTKVALEKAIGLLVPRSATLYCVGQQLSYDSASVASSDKMRVPVYCVYTTVPQEEFGP
jgi:hypothetical protein